MTDWIDDAEKACAVSADGAFGNTLTQQKAKETVAASLPRALNALRAADELANSMKGKAMPGEMLTALTAYRKARHET